uniref:JmjC domain-containing protein n=1 Tax=Chromera velia CCMP2878 TaxID=1169474 RepID=A0A0G4FGC0_9ALVE|eukprot:Cvel_16695.t1-p1 / transcript=Cvel_16695.t1 / gene=Cvel_16695 / organism=Chromera_velia_CCMP2878 / gene_product=JmjC domain-containing protein 4, putative / transcript_product=JmjC domain-containing protein 4, putative / location=Cvel_scaffold1296:31256-36220(-) / protein_length=599 / sequence_SO=supercontig / SO=protein_coding / is_pseudo=false
MGKKAKKQGSAHLSGGGKKGGQSKNENARAVLKGDSSARDFGRHNQKEKEKGSKQKQKKLSPGVTRAHKLAAKYEGYCPFSDPPSAASVPCVRLEDLTGDAFFEEFVLKRRPVKIQGLLPDLPAAHLWVKKKTRTAGTQPPSGSSSAPRDPISGDPEVQYDYLTSKAGTSKVEVEVREDSDSSFGKGRKVRMTFGAFLEQLQGQKGHLYYLTTQSIPQTIHGPRRLCSPPLSDLLTDFPLRPSPLLHRLVPYQYNLWMGRAPPPPASQWSTTGLHHDFHDNLYVLLKGRKQFRLFSPRCVPYLSTVGRVVSVGANGLISYSEGMRDDGAHVASLLVGRQKRAQAAVASGGGVEAERELDAVMDEVADLAASGVALEDLEDDDLDEEGEGEMEEEVEEEEEEGDEGAASSSSSPSSYPDSFCRAATVPREGTGREHGEEAGEETQTGSLFDLDISGHSSSTSDADVLCRYLECNIEAGEMLYLPASWFHEVHSGPSEDSVGSFCSSSSSSSSSSTAGEGRERQDLRKEEQKEIRKGRESEQAETERQRGVHMALNFWFYPPLITGTPVSPYPDDHWETRQKPLLDACRRAELEAERSQSK